MVFLKGKVQEKARENLPGSDALSNVKVTEWVLSPLPQQQFQVQNGKLAESREASLVHRTLQVWF